jgi:hypothetical protein
MGAAAGKGGRNPAALIRAFYRARDAGNAGLMEETALNLPSSQRFGVHPGQVPALVHEAYAAAAEPESRSRLAAALARAWVYGGDPERATAFADEAVDLADAIGDPTILAGALDAALLAHWGPDAFAERQRLAARLDDTAAHLAEPALRLSAHLWRLTTAWECLDVVAVRRQLRALDVLADESGAVRMAFFATSRRAMYALVTGDIELADRLIARTRELGAESAEPDVEAVVHSLSAGRARRAGDAGALRSEAAAFEDYGASEGVPSVSAEAAVLWLEADEPDRSLEVLQELAGGGLDRVARDVDFLLTVASLVDVGSALHRDDVAADGLRMLEPYAGRAVLNAGAVTFHGVVDDYLSRACQALGRIDEARWRDAAASGYQRIGARWWPDRLAGSAPATQYPVTVVHLRRHAGHGWVVGRDGVTTVMSDLRGLRYLHHLLQRPGADVSSLDLAAAAAGHPGSAVSESGGGEILDARALAAYRLRLRDIDSELAEAESWADQAALVRLQLERDALLHEVGAATGLAGRRRRFGSAGERARVAVQKAIAAALTRIGHHDPALARLLRDSVRTGATCRYEPDPARPVGWQLEPAARPAAADPERGSDTS